MKYVPFQQAAGRLKLTERAVLSLHAVGYDPIEFQTHWLDFLVQWKGTYTKIQQAAKDSPQEIQWFGNVTRERKADPLLRYLFEARNDGEHGLDLSTRHVGDGFEWQMTREVESIRRVVGPDGFATRMIGPDGEDCAVRVKRVPAESFLIEVTEFDGKKKVPVPTSHLGEPMEAKPLIAADLGFRWLQKLVTAAQFINGR